MFTLKLFTGNPGNLAYSQNYVYTDSFDILKKCTYLLCIGALRKVFFRKSHFYKGRNSFGLSCICNYFNIYWLWLDI